MTAHGSELRICWIKDGKPGHLTKVRGLLKSIGEHRSVVLTECEVKWRPRCMRALMHNVSILRRVYPLKACLPESVICGDFDLVISAGGATEWANARLAESCAAKNIYFGSLRVCRKSAFTLLPRVDIGNDINHLSLVIIPSVLDAHMARAEALKVIPECSRPIWAVLIGGDGSGVRWTTQDWERFSTSLIKRAQAFDARLLVSTSRRTGAVGELVLKKAFEGSGLLLKGVWPCDFDRQSMLRVPALLGNASMAFVTEDSASMVNEAIASGRPVVTLKPDGAVIESRVEGMLQRLAEERYIYRSPSLMLNEIPKESSNWQLLSADWHVAFGASVLSRMSL
ncbi:MAG: ELM1/GtrOC1 family putative glycosyltransferase [Opitutaceae bacterium]